MAAIQPLVEPVHLAQPTVDWDGHSHEEAGHDLVPAWISHYHRICINNKGEAGIMEACAAFWHHPPATDIAPQRYSRSRGRHKAGAMRFHPIERP
jgi:hypothetical protein